MNKCMRVIALVLALVLTIQLVPTQAAAAVLERFRAEHDEPGSVCMEPMNGGGASLRNGADVRLAKSMPRNRSEAEESARPAALDFPESPATDFSYSTTTVDGESVIRITGYKGSDASVRIPQTIDGKPVRLISGSAFNGKTVIEQLIIPEGVTTIQDAGSSSYGAFRGLTNLNAVSLPSTLTLIGDYAFYGCTALTEMNVPAAVKTIGAGAFYNCTALAKVTLNKGLETVEGSAFYGCAAITAITLPEGLKTVGTSAFSGTSIESMIFPDSVTSVSVSGLTKTKHLHWPGGVPTVSGSQFMDMTALETVELGEGVTTIGNSSYTDVGAFNGLKNLKSVKLPSTLTSIGGYAFSGCIALAEIEIPEAVKSIGSGVFSGCISLAKVTLNKGLESIGYNAFRNCSALTAVTLPEGLLKVENYAFVGTAVETLIFPDSVTSVSVDDLAQVKHLHWPGGVPTVSGSQFMDMTALETVELGEGVTTIGNSSYTDVGAFNGLKNLKSVKQPGTLTSIGSYAFSGCIALAEIEIPEAVKSIGSGVFSGCTSLAKVTLNKGLETIGSSAFRNCSALTAITLPEGLLKVENYAFVGTAVETLIFPDSVTSVSVDDLAQVKHLHWPGGVPSVSGSQFMDMTALETVELGEGVTTIGNSSYTDVGAFNGLKNLKSVKLPGTLTSIGSYAFSGCIALAEIEIPEAVKSIGSGVFSGCTSLAKVTLNKGLETIGSSAFRNCSALTAITLPEGLETIELYSFEKCSALTEVTLPKSIRTIKSNAFSGCKKLTSIELPYGLETLESNAFGQTGITELELPDSVTKFSAGESFRNQVTYIRWTAGIPVVPNSVFQEAANLKTVVIPEGVTEIQDGKVEIVEGILENTAYLYGAFMDAVALETVFLPDSMTKIGKWAFRDCESLAYVRLGKNIETIASDAFQGCPKFIMAVYPGTPGEQYAIDHGYEYIYVGLQGVVEVTLDPAGLRGMILELTCGDIIRTQKITDAEVYRFAGLKEDGTCTIRICNSYGDVVAVLEDIRIGLETSVQMEPGIELGDLKVKVLDEQGNDLSDVVSIDWFTGDWKPYSSGMALSGVPAGTELQYNVLLDGAVGQLYVQPETAHHTIQSGTDTLTLRLKRVGETDVTGTVMCGEQPVAGAVLIFEQTINGKYVRRNQTTTDETGAFAARIADADAQVRVYASGCWDHTFPISGGNANLGTIELVKIDGIRVSVHALLLNGAEDDAVRLWSMEDLHFEVYNESRNEPVSLFLVQSGELILAEGADVGERLRITVSSLSGSFAPVTEEILLENDAGNELSVELTEYGSIHVVIPENLNPAVRVMVFDGEDRRVRMTVADGAQREVSEENLPDGDYTVVLIGDSSFFRYPASTEAMALAGLEEGADYAAQTVSVSSGAVTKCIIGSLPRFDETRFYYTDAAATGFSASKTLISAGQFFTLRASAAFLEAYAGAVSEIRWVFELPEQLEYFDGTLSVGGSTEINYTYEDNVLLIPVEDPAAVVRFCANGVGRGSGETAASLEFVHDGQRIRQPVGAVSVKVDELSLDVTEKTLDPTVTVSGTAAGSAMVQIYDNGVLAGQTRSGESGYWQLTFDLVEPGSFSEHSIEAHMQLASGTMVRSAPKMLMYQYSPEPIGVSTVSMHLNGSSKPAAVFDFEDPAAGLMTYTVENSAAFTFITRFHCPDMTRLSNVKLEIPLTDGTTDVLDSFYDPAQEGFVSSKTYSIYAMPVNVSVSYRYDAELVYAQEHVSDIHDASQWISDLIPEEGDWQLNEEDFEKIILDFECEVEAPQELYDTIDAYNVMLDEYILLMAELESVQQECFGDVLVEGETFTALGGIYDTYIECDTLSDLSFEDLAADGFESHQIGGAASDGRVLSRMDLNPESGELDMTIIDASGGTEGTAYHYNVDMTPADQVPTDSPAPVNTEAAVITSEKVLEVGGYIATGLSGLGESADKVYAELVKYGDRTGQRSLELSQQAKGETDPVKKEALRKRAADLEQVSNKSYNMAGRAKNLLEKAGMIGDVLELILSPASIRQDQEALARLTSDAIMNGGTLSDWALVVERVGLIWVKTCASLLALLGIAKVMKWIPKGPAMAKRCLELAGYFAPLILDLQQSGVFRCIREKFSGLNANGNGVLVRKIDPSGYIYEAVASNRLEGVKVTCYERVTEYDMFDEPHTVVRFWDGEPYGEINPQITDAQGRYAWDVPDGWYQVKAEMEGYETTYSEWLPVPPPQLEVNLGLVSYEAPVIESVDAAPGAVEIVFSKYMRTDLFGAAGVTVTANGKKLTGALELTDAEANPENSGEMFVRTVRFLPAEPIADGTQIEITVPDLLCSYVGVMLAGENTVSATVTARPEAFTAELSVLLPYGGNGTIRVQASPAELAAGMTVTVRSDTDLFVGLDRQSRTLDANGCAEFRLTGKLPGTATLVFGLEGTDLTAQTQVHIQMPTGCDLGHTIVTDPAVAPTCTENGCTEHRYCSKCFEVFTARETIPALGHDWDEGIVIKEPTEQTEGERQHTCRRCSGTKVVPIPALDHEHRYQTEVKAPTCTEGGYTRHFCDCGDQYTTDPVAALGHDFTDWIVTREPTEAEAGLEERSCRRCGHTEQRTIAARDNPFTDVAPGSFYFEPVMWAVENGITNGTSSTTFGPNDQCMRAHVVTFLWRAVGSPEPTGTNNPFVDVKPTDFYYKPVLWALEKGITSGMDATHFGPTSYCNRAQVVTFLYRTMGSPALEGMDNPFTDVQAGAFYEKPVLWAVRNGITNGLTATTFGPNAICNRAQIVTFLYRAFVND